MLNKITYKLMRKGVGNRWRALSDKERARIETVK